jgi:hypothetical protein
MAEVFTRFLSDQIPVIACKNSRSGRMWRTFLSLTAMLEVALSLACGFFAIYLIGRWKIFRLEGVPVQVFQLLFITKVLAAVVLYLIYTRFYSDRATADIFRYYDDSAILYNSLAAHPFDFFRMLTGIGADQADLLPYYDAMRNWYNTDLAFNDSRTMIRINAFLRLFSMGTYFPHAVVMCFLAMVGLTGIFRLFNKLSPNRTVLLTVIVYLLPSTLLWTSGMVKEAFLMFALGVICYRIECVSVSSISRWKNVVLLLVSVFFLLTVKAYVFFLVLPMLVFWWAYQRNSWLEGWKAPVFYFVYFLLLAQAAPFITGSELPALLASKQAEFFQVAITEQAKSLIEIPRLQPDWQSLLLSAPGAFLRALLLPLPWQAHNILMWLSVLENLFIATLLLMMIFSIRKADLVRVNAAMLACAVFGVSIFVLSGWVTPIIGALVRYKVPGLPFVLFIFLSVSYRKWMDGGNWLFTRNKSGTSS